MAQKLITQKLPFFSEERKILVDFALLAVQLGLKFFCTVLN